MTTTAPVHYRRAMTAAQVETITRLLGEYQVHDWMLDAWERDPFDLPAGWVAGWARGVYYGIDPQGRAHS